MDEFISLQLAERKRRDGETQRVLVRKAAEVRNFLVDSGLQPAVVESHVTWAVVQIPVQVSFGGDS